MVLILDDNSGYEGSYQMPETDHITERLLLTRAPIYEIPTKTCCARVKDTNSSSEEKKSICDLAAP